MPNSHSNRYAAISIRYIPSCLQNKIKKKRAMRWNTDFYIKKTDCYVFTVATCFGLYKTAFQTDVPLLAVGPLD